MDTEKLVRDSERLEIIKRYVKSSRYIDKEILEMLIDIQEEKEGE